MLYEFVIVFIGVMNVSFSSPLTLTDKAKNHSAQTYMMRRYPRYLLAGPKHISWMTFNTITMHHLSHTRIPLMEPDLC